MFLENKYALMYGAGGAIGAVVARAFAREREMGFLAGRPPANIERVAKDISAGGGMAGAAQLDALEEKSVEKYITEGVGRAGARGLVTRTPRNRKELWKLPRMKRLAIVDKIEGDQNMKISCSVVIVSLAVLAAGGLQAAEEKSDEKGTEIDSTMREAMTRGAPGEHHQALELFAGRFMTTSRIWMKPGEAPQESTGSAEHTWVLGGRFLMMDVRGDMGGQAYVGLGYLGYDNIRGEYIAVWLDNMNTGITRASGQFEPATRTYTERGTFSCPITGEKDMRFRGEWKAIDNDTLSYTMYNPGADGADVKGMEISYKRVQ